MTTRHLGLALSALLLAQPASAFHSVFDFAVDHFEADGNALGTLDGSPDFVDDFNASQNEVTIKVQTNPWSVIDDTLLPALSSGKGPDIVAMPISRCPVPRCQTTQSSCVRSA